MKSAFKHSTNKQSRTNKVEQASCRYNDPAPVRKVEDPKSNDETLEEVNKKTQKFVKRLTSLPIGTINGSIPSTSKDRKMSENSPTDIGFIDDNPHVFDKMTQMKFDLSHKARLLSNIIENGVDFAIENSFEDDKEFITQQSLKTTEQQKADLEEMENELYSMPSPA